MSKKITFLLWVFCASLIVSCSEDETYVPIDEPDPVSPVNFDIENVPFDTLSEYNFFEGSMANLDPVYGVVPYTLINTLFSDYAKKKRFVWMPSDVKANYNGDNAPLSFPVGTILIKNFYYENVLPSGNTKILETRLMIRKAEGWEFANYRWNDQQTEATYDMNGSFVDFEWEEGGQVKSVNYRIPAGAECQTCHKTGEDIPLPIGPKPRNLNLNYAYSDGNANQLAKLIDMNYLEDNLPANIETMVSWKDPSASMNDRARAYLDINCAHCHSEEAHCAYRPVRFSYEDTVDPVNLGLCVEPDTDLGVGMTHIVNADNVLRSMMYYRLNTTDEAVRMPLMGRTLIHEEGVQLIFDWNSSLESTCN